MAGPTTNYSVLEALHDGTIVAADRGDEGSLLLKIDIEYLAEVLEAGSTLIHVRVLGCRSATFSPYGDEGPGAQDLLQMEEPDITILSLSDDTASEGELVLHCVDGTLRLSCDALSFATESGVQVSAGTLRRASRLYWERWEARGLARKLGLRTRAGTLDDLPTVRRLYTELLAVLAKHNPHVDPTHELQSDWVEKPGQLFTWVVERVDDQGGAVPVGMALVCGKAYCEALGSSTDFWLYEFVITEAERRRGIGRASVALVLDAHDGEWCLDVLPGNAPAMGFWTASLAHLEPRTQRRTDDEGVEFERFVFHTRVPLDGTDA